MSEFEAEDFLVYPDIKGESGLNVHYTRGRVLQIIKSAIKEITDIHMREITAYRLTVENKDREIAGLRAALEDCVTDSGELDAAIALKALAGTAPVSKEYAEWVPVAERLPEPNSPVLLDIGKGTPIRAVWAAKGTVEAMGDDSDWAEYDEETGASWCPEGWYEWNQHEEVHWAVNETPIAWMELPATHALRMGGQPC